MEPQKQNDGVRYKLANAMKECMRTAPVEKITVKEIVETCGLTRQTFYRNFQDKYDLINWYFDKILLESFEHMGEGRTVYESLVNKFEYIQMEQLFNCVVWDLWGLAGGTDLWRSWFGYKFSRCDGRRGEMR